MDQLQVLVTAEEGTWYNYLYSWMVRHASDNAGWVTGYLPIVLYQATEDTTFADDALALLESQFLHTTQSDWGGDYCRRWPTRVAMIYDWVYDYANSTTKAKIISKGNEFLTYMMETNADGTSKHLSNSDTDEILGYYSGAMLWYIVTADENPTAITIANTAWLGGVSASGGSYDTTVRNEIFQLITVDAAGGSWPEGTYYNPGTMGIWALQYQAMKTGFGHDYFSESPKLFSELGLHWIHLTTPDIGSLYRWGDEGYGEDARDFATRSRDPVSISWIMSSMADDYTVQCQCWSYLQALLDLYAYTMVPADEVFFFFISSHDSEDFRQLPMGTCSISSTTSIPASSGICLYRSGWTANDSLIGIEFPRWVWLDHMTSYHGNFQLYRKGEWVFTHPGSYGEPTTSGTGGSNTMILNGFPMYRDGSNITPEMWHSHEYKPGAFDYEFGENYVFISGNAAGAWNYNGSWYVPPSSQHEHTRSILYLSSQGNTHDTIILCDRLYVLDPRQLDKWDEPYYYTDGEKTQIEDAEHRKMWYFHMLTVPEVSGSQLTFDTAGGQHAKLQTITPTITISDVVDEHDIWPSDEYYIPDTERMYHVVISPSVDRDWDVMLHVMHAWDNEDPLSIGSTVFTNSSTGVLLHRTGEEDCVVVFNAEKGSILPSPGDPIGYWDPEVQVMAPQSHLFDAATVISFKAWIQTASLTMYISDLDPLIDWELRIDGELYYSLDPNAAGFYRREIPDVGEGSHIFDIYDGSETEPPYTESDFPSEEPPSLSTSARTLWCYPLLALVLLLSLF
ncbi:Oligo alginate lyase [Pelomyxa schiedti]|nr:Oligo alginate lyase [Pelomyxa schiedti]